MRILISGGSGFIGQALAKVLQQRGDDVVIWSRNPGARAGWVDQLDKIREPVDAVVNLAGAGIVDRRWSASRKQLLRDSRIQTTAQLVNWMAGQASPPKVLISGSAIGYYGSQASGELDESSPPVKGFTHQLCADWETEALKAEALGVRVCLIRTGVVLGRSGGALKKMLPPFQFGLGGPIGTGQQWMSWIHLDDETGAICWLLDHSDVQGAFNLTAPEAVTNSVFSTILGRVLHRPAFFRVPAVVMKLMLGEASELLLEGQCVKPVALQKSGYAFRYPALKPALENLLR
ncbi:Cell division inhibitor [Nitrincola lacisaponensis]|uniref:Cell division inhibitor n=1 Tax=Nitrincola lacisaponensis TaxID=267850 RepID=A0A063Y0F2_9GAMM|nr:TIGR01777 family oxidoreductase [Nitrincola lacisaponensis]KDE39179.1 Cell division inhibitor [Nitrincola lacisaponensis]